MNRKEAMAKELELKNKLRTMLKSDDEAAVEAVRDELTKVRDVIGPRTLEETYGSLAY